MVQVYKTTGSSLGMAAMTSTAAIVTGVGTLLGPTVCVLGGGIGSFAAMWAFQSTDVTTPVERRTLLLGVATGLGGLSLAPLLSMAAAVNPMAIPMALGGTVVAMGGATMGALFMKRGAMLKWAPLVYGGSALLVGASLVAMIQAFFFPPISPLLHSFTLWGGLGLFVAFQTYDTQNVIERFRAGDGDFLRHSADFYMNAMGIFRRLLYIFMQRD